MQRHALAANSYSYRYYVPLTGRGSGLLRM